MLLGLLPLAVLSMAALTRADALRIVAMVLDSKKTLKTIYISQADPDYYFGAEVLKQVFPEARLVSTAPTRQKIEATLANKLPGPGTIYMSQTLKFKAPVKPGDTVTATVTAAVSSAKVVAKSAQRKSAGRPVSAVRPGSASVAAGKNVHYHSVQ